MYGLGTAGIETIALAVYVLCFESDHITDTKSLSCSNLSYETHALPGTGTVLQDLYAHLNPWFQRRDTPWPRTSGLGALRYLHEYPVL